jgi:chromosome segregation ATPase
MPSQDRNGINDEDLGEAIAALERSLTELKERYAQVRRDQQRYSKLEAQKARLEAQPGRNREIKAQLQQLQQELDTLELSLESRLFNWRSFSQPFWQAVRFGGLGIAIGWLLKSCATIN